MYQKFWKLCLIANLVLCVVSTAHSQDNSGPQTQAKSPAKSSAKSRFNTGHVTLANGDRMPASINLFSKGELEFGSTLFNETVKLNSEHLHSFGFRSVAGASDVPSESPFLFRLKSGTRLTGELISLDRTRCILESSAFGKMTVPIANLIEISKQVDQPETTVYSALNWQQLKHQNRPDAQGRLWIAANAKAPMLAPQRLNRLGRFEVDFLCDKRTEFQIQLRDQKNKNAVSIGVADGTIVLEAGDELEFGDFETVYGSKRLTIDWDGETIHILNELGRSLAKTKLKSESPLSVSIENEGSVLRINELSTSTTNHQVTTGDFPIGQMSVKRVAGDWAAAKAITADAATLAFESQQGGAQRIEIAQVERVWFGTNTDKTETVADPAAESPPGYTCLWRQGQRIVFDQLELQNDRLAYVTNEFESQNFVRNLPAKVFLPQTSQATATTQKTTPPGRDPVNQEFLLAISGIPFSGSYSQGDINNPVRWQFFGFIDPVSLNIQRKIEIRRKAPASSRRIKDTPDRLLLNDGSIIPCRVGMADRTKLNFESKQISSKSVPVDEMRCCFFNSNNLQWQATLTNETVKRALTLPRFSNDLPFTHVLIGRNGDLLRGDLVRIGKEEIEFESRFEPLLIARKNVAGIVAVDASPISQREKETDDPAAPSAPDPVTQIDSAPVIVHVDCGNDFVAVGKYVSLDDKQAVLNSPLLGEVKLDGTGIRQLAFNSQFRDVSALQYFADWQVNASVKPRWTEEVEFAADSNELLNQPAPDFGIPMLSEGEVFQLSNHLGKLVVINFWETTSKPSVRGIPQYRDVIQKFSPQNVVFVAVNQGETTSAVGKFLADQKWNTLDIAMDSNRAVSEKFKVTGIPHLTILDRSGVVRFIKVGYSTRSAVELEQQLRGLLNE